ncbi:MAG TPA: hypothetical protein DDW52_05745 [Planctomycetaceae bacterium]|nr:hypothetical protein [Planctomycetaceae bacterium]
MRILLVGSTGLTGRIVANRLRENGAGLMTELDVVAFHRETSDTTVLPGGISHAVGDLENLQSELLKNVNVVIFAAGSGSKTGPEKTIDVDQNSAITLMDLSVDQRVDHFVMLSSKGAEAPEEAEPSIQHYMRAKRTADDHLIRSGLSYSIIRPVPLTTASRAGCITLAPRVAANDHVSREDLADVLIAAMSHSSLVNQVAELGSGSTPTDLAVASFRALQSHED